MAEENGQIDLRVQLGRLALPNPMLVASGTFGYAREMERMVDLGRLGGILPKTITPQPRAGKHALADGRNDGRTAQFDRPGQRRHRRLHRPSPALPGEPVVPVIVSIAGKTRRRVRRDGPAAGRGRRRRRGGTEYLLPERERRGRFRRRSARCAKAWSRPCGTAARLPILAKLTPNVTGIADDRQGGRGGRRRRHVADQHRAGHGRRLAQAAADAGQRAGRPERSGDQAGRPAVRVPGRPGRRAFRWSASAASPRSTT